MHFKQILIIILILQLAQSNDYNSSYIQRCYQINYSPELRNVFILHYYDTLFIKIMFPFSFLACIATIVLYIKFKATRQQPGDIILALTISQMFLISSFIATVIYDTYHPYGALPSDFVTFCNITGYAYSLSFCTQFIYNICFCTYFIVRIKNVLKDLKRIKLIIHFCCLFLLLIAAIILYFTECIGVSIFGYCAFKVSSFNPFIRSILVLVYLTCLIVTIGFFKKYVPKIKNNQIQRRNFLKYYYRYNVAISINLTMQTIFNLVSAINCNVGQPNPKLEIFLTLSNISSLTTPFIFFFVIAFHPQVSAYFRSLYYKLINRIKPSQSKQLNQTQNKAMELIQNVNNYNFLQNLIQTSKTSLIYTILMALYIQDTQTQQFSKLRQLTQWNYHDKVQYQINEQLIKNMESIKIKDYRVMNTHITAYAPRAFKSLMHIDGYQNLKKHINPTFNISQIQKSTRADGGKSGEFFFFTNDNQIVIKTLTNEQLNLIKQHLKQYIEHFVKHPYSLILKIYGVYTIKNITNNQSYHIFVMRNIARCSKKYIKRIYDLKGSKFDRKVLEDYSDISPIIRQTMKDIDFFNIQKKIYLDTQQSLKIKQILIQDSKFLRQLKLIDYSLIIMKIAIKDYLQQNNITVEQFLNSQTNPYSYVFNNQDKNLAYAIGIIDFLETWNVKKKSEKLTKNVFFLTKSEDISAQSPERYSARFQNQLINIIF